jgi:hypothetical protein
VILFVFLFSVAIVRETTDDRGYLNEPFFQTSNPPDPLASELSWISNTYGSQHLVLMVSGQWPNGPYPSYLEWSVYDLHMNSVSSFLYLGTLYDIINGIPSQVISRPDPLPGDAPPVVENVSNYHVLVIDNPGTMENFYTPNSTELQILHQLIPGVYALDNLTASQIKTWSSLWEHLGNTSSSGSAQSYNSTNLIRSTGLGELSAGQNYTLFPVRLTLIADSATENHNSFTSVDSWKGWAPGDYSTSRPSVRDRSGHWNIDLSYASGFA